MFPAMAPEVDAKPDADVARDDVAAEAVRGNGKGEGIRLACVRAAVDPGDGEERTKDGMVSDCLDVAVTLGAAW